jgi:hypothetical protein
MRTDKKNTIVNLTFEFALAIIFFQFHFNRQLSIKKIVNQEKLSN